MTTEELPLDRDDLARFEPSEGDERHTMLLSPFAVPTKFRVRDIEGGFVVEFKYPGGEEPTTFFKVEGFAPEVEMTIGKWSRKVVAIKVNVQPKEHAWERLLEFLKNLGTIHGSKLPLAQRLSCRLIGSILQDIPVLSPYK